MLLLCFGLLAIALGFVRLGWSISGEIPSILAIAMALVSLVTALALAPAHLQLLVLVLVLVLEGLVWRRQQARRSRLRF